MNFSKFFKRKGKGDDQKRLPEEAEKARDLLKQGDPKNAFLALRPLLDYPGEVADEAWESVWNLFGEISDAIVGREVGDPCRAAAKNAGDPKTLYDLGYALIEYGLHSPAAGVLKRAYELAPQAEPVVSEYSTALEHIGLNDVACSALRGSGLADSSFTIRYLLAFNTLMTADVDGCAELLNGLEALKDRSHPHADSFDGMENNLQEMIDRARSVAQVCALDGQDLRGWTWAVNAGLLLHLSPHGLDEPMRGRYAWLQEPISLLHEGVARLQAVLDAAEFAPPRLWSLPDRDSLILAHVAAETLNLPVQPWPAGGTSDPGLVVSYNLAEFDENTGPTLTERSSQQIYWCHACDWTQSFPFSPDVVTYFYQHATPPWGEHIQVHPETREPSNIPARTGSQEEVAAAMLSERPETLDLEDLPKLRDLAQIVLPRLPAGRRTMFRTDSPVKSNRFT